ncbi:C1 family peptidase [Companilactobacillus allii]|uniref:Aminopeptidase n=1 Tax=Companilactobacillus allii TaxID=1847728 RepID=A0A1P8Q156_9LACO|nr:C1 family peptidase [Companilactobacillus allii]APX71529.1 aminopeptidase [Companilactobacillus allii]USQ68611.1 C1 family peptidase [Companilactobacillus allii]
MTKEINSKILADFHKNLNQDASNNILKNAVAQVGIFQTAQNSDVKSKLNPTFNITVPTGKVSNQKRSGRCWLFSSLTNLRTEFAMKYDVADFELSQNYLSFFDRLEKANYFYQNIIETANLPVTDRKVNALFSRPNGDGGYWQYATDLIKKYGVVPDYAFPETAASSNTAEFDSVIGIMLRKNGIELRELVNDNKSETVINERVDEMLSEIYKVCVYSFGQPPKEFELSIGTDSKKMIEEASITPKEFLKQYFTMKLDDYVDIINAPQDSKEFGKIYTVEATGNMVGGQKTTYLNLPIERLKELSIAQMKGNDTVWFGNDVGKQSHRTKGLLSGDLHQIDQLFGIDTKMSKGEGLDYKQSEITHAMTLTGVNLINGQPNRFKVENSWGEANGEKGYFTMDDQWFDRNVYDVVINKKYLSADELEMLKQEPIVLAPWDSIA